MTWPSARNPAPAQLQPGAERHAGPAQPAPRRQCGWRTPRAGRRVPKPAPSCSRRYGDGETRRAGIGVPVLRYSLLKRQGCRGFFPWVGQRGEILRKKFHLGNCYSSFKTEFMFLLKNNFLLCDLRFHIDRNDIGFLFANSTYTATRLLRCSYSLKTKGKDILKIHFHFLQKLKPHPRVQRKEPDSLHLPSVYNPDTGCTQNG